MKWKDKLKEWSKGKVLKYPTKINKPFFYETSFISSNYEEEYKEKFIESDLFDNIKQNYKLFKKYIIKSKNKYVITFLNLSKTSLLIIPYPKQNKKFTTLKHFIDNSTKLQQKKFWKKVSNSIKKMLKIYKKVWVSTHGTGVPYLHIRIDTIPKYYITNKFK
tara:strand:- start:1378 stop:1863 length:486 start_codon:yes stop_codon:yes gene_type:complete